VVNRTLPIWRKIAVRARRAHDLGTVQRDKAHFDLDIAHSLALGFSEYAGGPSLALDLKAGALRSGRSRPRARAFAPAPALECSQSCRQAPEPVSISAKLRGPRV
jgi:hypothetical protein